MHDPVAASYFGVPGLLILWLATVVSFGLFGWKVAGYLVVLRQARPEKRWGQAGRRLKLVAAHVFGQGRLFGERVIGAAHFLIFWAFVLYAVTFFWNLARGLLPWLPVPYADQVPVVRGALDVFAVLGLAALGVAAARRYLFTPPRLERSRDATLILALIAVVLVSSLAGSLLPQAELAGWWLHMLTVLGFLAYLPYSKHLHLLASPFGVFTAALDSTAVPGPGDGASRREEFTWRELLNGLACAECGRCDRACPSVEAGYALAPKTLMRHMKELVRGETGGREFAGDVVRREEIWACATCRACMQRCPVFNEHIPVVVELRRRLVGLGSVETRLQEALTRLARYGNSFGQSARARSKWTQDLPFKIKDARKEPVEYLWFTGDYAAFDPRVQPVTRAAARAFEQAGLDVGLLYEAEVNAGNDVRRAGEEGLFEVLMEKNLAAAGQAAWKNIVTTDPHTYNALKNEYAWANGHGRVLHHTELLDELVGAGRLRVRRKLGLTAVYHDPCYLGRYNGVYAAPRRLLRSLGVKLAEMPRSRERAWCCGAGGGRIWMEDSTQVRERPAEARVREAAAIAGVGLLVVGCPKDLIMFQDAIKTAGLEGSLAVRDMAQLVEEACHA